MKSSPGFHWAGINLYKVGLDMPMDTTNRSDRFKSSVKTLEKHFDAAQTRTGNDFRVPLKRAKA